VRRRIIYGSSRILVGKVCLFSLEILGKTGEKCELLSPGILSR
jgi:hypothetical protein